jgi:CubicO group peptidase (beta-lactamase class C family)
MVAKLGGLPLKHQPGSAWEYSVATDVLGRFVEVVSGTSLDKFFKERIFKPLGMNDTGFHAPEEDHNRVVSVYTMGDDGKIRRHKANDSKKFFEPTTFLSGGGGLVSTATDYVRFCQMVLNRGELDGVRILRSKTVEMMMSNQLGGIPAGEAMGMKGAGFGLGFRVKLDNASGAYGSSAGTCTWGGMASTSFWIDPEKEFIGVFLTQILPTNFTAAYKFKKMAYEVIEN